MDRTALVIVAALALLAWTRRTPARALVPSVDTDWTWEFPDDTFADVVIWN